MGIAKARYATSYLLVCKPWQRSGRRESVLGLFDDTHTSTHTDKMFRENERERQRAAGQRLESGMHRLINRKSHRSGPIGH